MENKPLAVIVEDEPQLNQLFAVTLKGDFEIVQIYDGDYALQELERRVPNLIVLDLNLPGASGDKVLRQIRADQKYGKTRVILATANALQAAALEEQADIVLLKPISPAQLRDLASRII